MKIIKNIFLYIIDFLTEIWESIVTLFMNYSRKKKVVEGYIISILDKIFLYDKIEDWTDPKWTKNEYNEHYQVEIFSELRSDASFMREVYLTRGWGSSKEYSGMVYNWFIKKFDINTFSKKIFEKDSPVTKEDLLDDDLLIDYLENHIIRRKGE